MLDHLEHRDPSITARSGTRSIICSDVRSWVSLDYGLVNTIMTDHSSSPYSRNQKSTTNTIVFIHPAMFRFFRLNINPNRLFIPIPQSSSRIRISSISTIFVHIVFRELIDIVEGEVNRLLAIIYLATIGILKVIHLLDNQYHGAPLLFAILVHTKGEETLKLKSFGVGEVHRGCCFISVS